MYPFYVQGRKILRLSITAHEDCFLQPAQDVVKAQRIYAVKRERQLNIACVVNKMVARGLNMTHPENER
ncbi:hypothetical protein CIAN88_20610 [[Clostridium] innocuum]|uniref:Uncharacterized protein n=1 Tax=Clostridium innocuum TaxID=1522 RepID=A0A099I132_CLOIN|nr:hypothetical protein CIAN88_20610 [[Clostridium] innocuum]